MKKQNKKMDKKSLLASLKNLVREGKLDEDTARFLSSLANQAVVIRDAGRSMLESYNAILDAVSTVRGNLNIVLDNVQDVENYNNEED